MSKTVTLMDIKRALQDHRFRDALPMEFREDVSKYLSNPNCQCNIPIYRRILKGAKKQLHDYFPDKELISEEQQVEELAKNNFSVINCLASELESHLKKLPPGRKQIAIARFEDQVTVVVNELDLIY